MKLNMKKIGIGCIMLVLVALLGVAAWLMFKDKTTEGTQTAKNSLGIEWYDENGKEFTITTVEELYELGELSYHYDFAGQTIKLGADIVVNEGDATDWVDVMPEREWESIYGFAGTFDGQGHTISGIYCNGFLYQTNKWRVMGTDHVTAGLFRNTQKECVIKNLKLVNSYFYSDLNSGVGSISSYGGGTFDSIYTDAIVISEKLYVGGIMGRATADTTITNCWFDGSVEVVGGYGRYTGGILGRADSKTKCKIEHCLNSGTMASDLYKRGVNMGGILGQSWESEVEMNDCLVTGTLHNDWIVVGSVMGNVGTDSTVKMKDVYTITEAFDETVGYLGGKLTGYPVDFSKELLTGMGGYQWTTLDFDKYWTVVENGTPILQTFADKKVSVEGVAKNVDTSWYNEEESTYVLNDFADLYGFAIVSRLTDFADKTVKLGADITINSGKAADWAKTAPAYSWMPIGSTTLPFAGTFDGQKHTISGIYLKTDKTYNGLFGVTETTSKIKNLSLKNSYFETTANSFGSIAGRGKGVFDTVYSNAIVVGDAANIGGLVGQVPGKAAVKMNNCWFDGAVTNNTNDKTKRGTGGLIGTVLSDATITNCLNTGTISAPAYKVTNSATSKSVAPRVGGLVGCVDNKATATISYCLNTGAIKCNSAATAGHGSIVGSSNSLAKISNTFATSESCKNTVVGNSEGQAIVYDEAQLIGYGGYKWTTLDFQKYWSVVLDGTSVLKSFATKVPSLNGVARMVDISWYDKKADTYVLNDVADLYGFSVVAKFDDFAGKTVKLGADIAVNTGNASEWVKEAPENAWMSIGNNTLPFAGTFDGQMHTISGIYLKTDENYSGLFGVTGNDSIVKNVSLKNSYYESSAPSLGSVAGRGRGAFDTVYSDAIVVSSMANVGGIVGQVPGKANASLNNCWFDGMVTNTSNDRTQRATGGLVGVALSDVKISNCLNTGTIDVTAYKVTNSETSKSVAPRAGGLLGCVDNKATATIAGCLNIGMVKTSSAATAGYGSVVGSANSLAKIENTYATNESCKNTVVGNAEGQVIVYDSSQLVGYGGYKWTTLDFENYWSVVLDGTSILKSFAKQVPNINGVARMVDISWYNKKADTYVLNDVADLYGFSVIAKFDDFAGKTVKLGADITVNSGNASEWTQSAPENVWMCIGNNALPFAGTFDGQMHTISGLYLKTDETYAGLFGVTGNDSTVKNVSLKNSYFESSAPSLGSIAGRGRGVFDTVYSNAIVVSSVANAGGIVGQVPGKANASFNNCWFDGKVTNTSNDRDQRSTGGLVGVVLSDAKISNCLNTGTIDVTAYTVTNSATSTSVAPRAGGLLGCVDNKAIATITGCLNIGTVKTSSAATAGYGSIVGSANSLANITNTYATKESCSNTAVGTIEGEVIVYAEKKFVGYGGYQWTTLDFEKYWSVVLDGTSILKSFATDIPSLSGVAKMIDTSWYDEKKETYTLSDSADLYGFAWLADKTDFAGKTIKLSDKIEEIIINDGVAADWKTNAPTYDWEGIGSSEFPFAGTFDGNGKTISGVYVNADASGVGFFNYTSSKATIKNLKLTNSYIHTTKGGIGSIVGQGDGTFDTIYSDAIVDGTTFWIGGFVGRTATKAGITMNNCWFDGTVTQTGVGNKDQFACTGGLVGLVYNGSSFTNCLNTGDVTAYYTANQTPCVAGLVGRVNAGTITLESCMNTGLVSVDESATGNYGPIVGVSSASRTSASNTFAMTEHFGDESIAPAGVTKIAQEDLTGTDAIAGTFNLDYAKYWEVTTKTQPILKSFEEFAEGEILEIDTSWYDGSKNYTLKDVSDLYGFALLSYKEEVNGFNGDVISLAKDIEDLTLNAGTPYGADGVKDADDDETPDDWSKVAPEYEWPGIGTSALPFAGTLNGNMKTISGVYLNATTSYVGFFNYTNSHAIIKNLKITDSYFFTTKGSIGTIVGQGDGTFDTIYSNAIVDGTTFWVGGLIGRTATASGITMNNCWFDGKVTQLGVGNAGQYACAGGLVGLVYNGSTFTNCLNTGDVTAYYTANKTPCVAGLVGCVNAGTITVKNSLNTGVVTVDEAATGNYGPIVGVGSAARISASDTFALTEQYVEGESIAPAGVTNVSKDAINGTDALTAMANLFRYKTAEGQYKNYWAVVPGKAPVLESFASYAGTKALTIDTSWYKESDKDLDSVVYTLGNRADFYGFAVLSNVTNFANAEIKLSDHIEVNAGTPCGADEIKDTADDWSATVAPDYEWLCIGTFAGEFNGNNKTISGIYLSTTSTTDNLKGLFSVTTANANIHNFALVNSYFQTAGVHNGSIAGRAQGGRFDSIYSNAIIVGANQNLGGMIGQHQRSTSELNMSNCWFDGSVTNSFTSTTASSNVGGLIGCTFSNATVTSCLNTGAVTDVSEYTRPGVGGLVGASDTNTLTVSYCLNKGDVIYNKNKAVDGFGLLAGWVPSSESSFSYCYTTIQTSCSPLSKGTATTKYPEYYKKDANLYKGDSALTEAKNLFRTENPNQWIPVENAMPIPKTLEFVLK